ncbi:DUF2255 family protein [Streptomyces sp. NPDC055506]
MLDEEAYVRSAFGRRSAWYRRVPRHADTEVEAAGVRLPVTLRPVDDLGPVDRLHPLRGRRPAPHPVGRPRARHHGPARVDLHRGRRRRRGPHPGVLVGCAGRRRPGQPRRRAGRLAEQSAQRLKKAAE